MKKNIILILSILMLFFGGCGTKRQYFEPDKIAGKVDFSGSLSSSIVEIRKDGATLEDGRYIDETGLNQKKLPKGYFYLTSNDSYVLATDKCGSIKVFDNNLENLVYEKKFELSSIASASIDKNLLAVVSSTNKIYIINMDLDSILFQKQLEKVSALDYRMAKPVFLSSLVLFPSLDGKIVILDKNSWQIIRSVVISSEIFFNNIIFLEVLGDRMIAATEKRIISVSPEKTSFYDAEVRNIIALENRIYIFTNDGRIVLTDADLKVLKERKFEFALFSGAISGEFIYAVEKNGFLIATDKDLMSTNIYKLSDDIKETIFCTKNAIFFKDNFFKLSQEQ